MFDNDKYPGSIKDPFLLFSGNDCGAENLAAEDPSGVAEG